MTTTRLISYLAGLFHGIGEFMLLAENPASRSGYQNIAAASARFLDSQQALLERLFQDKEGIAALRQQVLAFAEEGGDASLRQAIGLARGKELAGSSAPEALAEKEVLGSIFETLVKEVKDEHLKHSFAMPGKALTIGDDFFPQQDIRVDWSQNWQAFLKEFAQLSLSAKHVDASLDSLLYLLERHLHTVPCVLSGQADVSLYDHLKTTAAFSLALCDAKLAGTPPQFLMVGGDISGIQDYIYDIISKYAAKNLKGRSFYLQLLVDTVIKQLLRALELPRAQVIYASGGGFFLLVARTEANENKLKIIAEELNDTFFEHHQANLYLALSWQAFTAEQIYDHQLGEIWKDLNTTAGQAKRQRYARLMEKRFGDMFEPLGQGGTALRDEITGEEIAKGEKNKENTEFAVLNQTQDQINIGKKLWQTTLLVSSWDSIPELDDARVHKYTLPIGKRNYYFLNERNSKLAAKLPLSSQVQSFNYGMEDKRLADLHVNWGHAFYGGNQYPHDPETELPLTFNDLAGRPDGDKKEKQTEQIAFARLGVLRMDVDSLGKIFIQGMHPNRKTMARYSCLSRNLDWFFKGYLNFIWQNATHLKNNTQILYAGGDDLFLVGRWDYLIEFAEEIQLKFKAWTCGNSEISISGGMAIVTPKYPISKGAEEAREAEEEAKDHEYVFGDVQTTFKKNAFCLLGAGLNWDYEYPQVKELKHLLKSLINDHHVSRSLLGRIRSHYFDYRETQKAQQAAKADPESVSSFQLMESWRWKLAYDFARFAKTQDDAFVRESLDRLKIGAFTGKFGAYHAAEPNHAFIVLLNLASRWAELELRTEQTIQTNNNG